MELLYPIPRESVRQLLKAPVLGGDLSEQPNEGLPKIRRCPCWIRVINLATGIANQISEDYRVDGAVVVFEERSKDLPRGPVQLRLDLGDLFSERNFCKICQFCPLPPSP